MPSRNIVREFEPDAFYHVYNRGVEKRQIFQDDHDYVVFLGLLKRYLGDTQYDKKTRHSYPKLSSSVELLAYCLMPNHFHLLFHQADSQGVRFLMQRLSTSYSMYFNKRNQRAGSLFQGPYKASRINQETYMHHISRYIHLNPDAYKTWPYSSYRYYLRTAEPPSWLHPEKVLEMFENEQQYAQFVDGYADTAHELTVLKWQLANDIDKGE